MSDVGLESLREVYGQAKIKLAVGPSGVASYARAEENERPFSRSQNEAAARRTDVESIANADTIPQPRSRHTVRLDLHADSI